MRIYRSQDRDSIIQMIDSIYKEYGDFIYLEGYDRDLLDIENNYFSNGNFWVETANNDDNKIIGSIAVKKELDYEDTALMKRFYLLPQYRGLGLAETLHDTVINWCKKNQISKLHLWSDTRFTRAHFFYQKNGYERGEMIDRNDGAMPYQEYYFMKLL
ncbi:GNAT family N-acetyltransferase [Mastigocoleus testarum]|uniref:N-acetyltransferase domain-containing protein n=1 Tax=Mastigocoleus testarum BC008 TaxID=371196 RepID=A0A0V7ZWG6_9CYAN|nr:GNAT family N-acetyltransferase [Mastigocoleus testarum]KST68575.1 hypothetical protein BC008_33520 [Mastigocoleus testarum BC008]